MLPSPTTLLATLALAVGGFGVGGYMGYNYGRGENAAGVATLQRQHLVRAIDNSIEDRDAAIERARSNVRYREKARVVFVNGVRDAKSSAVSVCDRSAESVSLLNDAIRVANGED